MVVFNLLDVLVLQRAGIERKVSAREGMRLTIILALAAHRVNRSPQGVERVLVINIGKRHIAARLADGCRLGGIVRIRARLVKPADERIPGCLRHMVGHGELIGIRIVLVPDQVLGTARAGFSVGLKLHCIGWPACRLQHQVIAHAALLEGVGDRAAHVRRAARGRIVVDRRLLQRVGQCLALQVRRGQVSIGDGVGIIAVIHNGRRCGHLSAVRLERQVLREVLRARTIRGLIARPRLGEGRFAVAAQQLARVGHAHRQAFRHLERLTGRIRHVVDGARVHAAHQLDDGVLLADGQIRTGRCKDIAVILPRRSERRGRRAGRSAALVDVERQRRALRGGGIVDRLGQRQRSGRLLIVKPDDKAAVREDHRPLLLLAIAEIGVRARHIFVAADGSGRILLIVRHGIGSAARLYIRPNAFIMRISRKVIARTEVILDRVRRAVLRLPDRIQRHITSGHGEGLGAVCRIGRGRSVPILTPSQERIARAGRQGIKTHRHRLAFALRMVLRRACAAVGMIADPVVGLRNDHAVHVPITGAAPFDHIPDDRILRLKFADSQIAIPILIIPIITLDSRQDGRHTRRARDVRGHRCIVIVDRDRVANGSCHLMVRRVAATGARAILPGLKRNFAVELDVEIRAR